MFINKKFLYLIFTFIIALGVTLVCLSYTHKTPEPTTPTLKLRNLSGTFIRHKQEKQLLSLTSVKEVSVNKNSLIIGDDSLSFRTDTLQGIITYLPDKADVWKNYWSALLGESVQADNSKRWDIAFMKIRIALFAEWEMAARQSIWAKLSDEQRLTYVLVSTIKKHPDTSFFIGEKTLRKSVKNNLKIINDDGLVVVTQTRPPETSPSRYYWLLSLALLISGVAGLIFTKKIPSIAAVTPEKKHEEKPDPTDNELTATEAIERDTAELNEADKVKTYIQHFYKRYGDFYTDIELLTEYPTDEASKQKIKQQIVEMGLHAHSFARAYLFNYLDRPQKEPNTLLIYDQKDVKELNSKLFKTLSLDGQETNKRYRYLAKIIAEMTINSLEGALLNDTYVSAETFEHLR